MNHHLLIAEDSTTQRAMLVADLEAAGFAVTAARDGQEALDALHRGDRPVDLVVSDVVMPRLDGLELCRRIKSDATLPDLPVVLLTSFQDPLDVVRGLEVGADNFLTKPYDADHLVARLEAILLRRDEPAADPASMQLLGQRFALTADRHQIVELLVGAFEDLVHVNHQLREREDQLGAAQADLAARLAQVERERARLSAVLDAIPDGVLVVDTDGQIADINPGFVELGIAPSRSEVVGTDVRELPITAMGANARPVPRASWPIVRAYHDCEATTTGLELTLGLPGGSSLPVTVTAAPVVTTSEAADQPTQGAVAVIRDASVWAFHDRLTTLPNRTLFTDRIERALVRATPEAAPAVLMVSLDRFTVVHDSLGRGAEDSLLVAVARRLVGTVRADATVARLGGDRFGILLERVSDVAEARSAARRVASVLERPVTIGREEIFLTASIGLACWCASEDAEDLLHHANAAVHRAIELGGARIEVYEQSLDAAARERLLLDSALRRALESEQFVVHFQPVVALPSGRAVEVEALVRWIHPERGMVSPAEFIPVAEHSGQIVPLGRWVLQEACRQVQRWRTDGTGDPDFRVSVNLSTRQFEEPGLRADVERILTETGLPAEALTLEVTESVLIKDPLQAAATLQSLRDLGIRIAIDDFGTGYSSLSYLRSIPLDVLKIDRSFIQQLGTDTGSTAIVRALLTLADSLELDVIAEGVETAEQLAWLRDAGCGLAAGFYLARPLAAPEVAPLLGGDLVPDGTTP